jgi:beta-1,4-mannosyl-glycoprotein beta-1,4-N-acetylglucosaminyltransferase
MAKVWDCFLFNDELELLYFRLSELCDVVDQFVLVEAKHTFRGQPKPLTYLENKSKFHAFAAKIKHIIVDDMPATVDTPWERERHQHAAILKGLVEVNPDDLVIVGDVDELPHAEVIADLRLNLSEPVRLVLHHCIYFANWKLPQDWGDASMVCRGSQLDHPAMDFILGKSSANAQAPRREHHQNWKVSHLSSVKRIMNAGWHLSYMGGTNAINKKFRQFSHSEFDIPKINNQQYLNNCIRLGVDFKGKFILHRQTLDELEPMLQRLYAQWPDTFQFPKHRNFFTAIFAKAYRRYARWRFLYDLPGKFVVFIDSHLILSLLVLTPPLLLADLGSFAKAHFKS